MALTQISDAGLKKPASDLQDNEKIILGTGDDLQIWHDGSNSYIKDNGTGELRFISNTYKFYNSGFSETLLQAFEDGAVELFHNNVKKFETTAGGATVHCIDASDGFIVQGDVRFRKESGTTTYIKWDGSDEQLEVFDDVKVSFGDGHDLQIYHDGSHSHITNSTGDLNIISTGDDVFIKAADDIYMRTQDDEASIQCLNSGSVSLYYDASKKFETLSVGASVTGSLGINTTSPTTFNANADELVLHNGSGTCGMTISCPNDSIGRIAFGDPQDNNIGEVRYEHSDNAMSFVVNAAERLRIDSAGNVGLGATSITANTNYNTLQIQGQSGTGGGILRLMTTDGSTSTALIMADTGGLTIRQETDHPIDLATNSTVRLRITSGGDIQINNDTGKFQLGAGQDLQFFHTGVNSYIRNLTGDLYIQTNNGSGSAETGITLKPNSAVELYYNDTKRLATTSSGVEVFGTEGGPATLILSADEGDDNADKWRLRAPNGSSGAPVSFTITNYFDGAWENNIVCTSNGAAELYYDGTKKFETTADGCKIPNVDCMFVGTNTDRTIYFDASINGFRWNDHARAYFGNGQDLEIYHNGSNSHISHSGTGNVYLDSIGAAVYLRAGDNAGGVHTSIVCEMDAGVKLYNNNSKKLETTSKGIEVYGFTWAYSDDSDSDHTGGPSKHVFQNHNSNHAAVVIEHSGDSNPYGLAIDFSDDNPDSHDRYFLSCLDSTTTRMKIYADGDVWNHDDAYTGSDETLKENIVDATSKIEDLKKLKVRNFNWKSDYFPEKSKTKQIGFIAQEVEQVFPSLVSEHNIAPGEGKDDNHTPVMKKAIKQAWAPILVKALQEAIAKIETLETEVAALKAK